MFTRIWRHGVLAAAAIATLAIAQPTLAFQEAGQSGKTGPHTVVDTYSNADTTCDYKSGPGSLSTLVHMWVNPPLMRSATGMGTEKVGWSFTIQRKIQGSSWSNRVTSTTFKANATASSNAVFSQKGVKVVVPNGPGGPTASYRTVINMYWYAANGSSVIGSAKYQVAYYFIYTKTSTTSFHGSCGDYEL